MDKKLISLILMLCMVLLPVQIYAYGGDGDGDGDGDDSFTSYGDIGVGGPPPLTFTPTGNSDYGIPDSYTNPGVAGSTTVLPDLDIKQVLRSIQEDDMNSGFMHRAEGHVYDALATVGGGAVVGGKVAVSGLALVGATAGIMVATPAFIAGATGTAAALEVVAVVSGGAALVGGALMQGAETYGDGIDKGKSQDDAARDGLISGVTKGVIDHAVNLTGLGTIDLIQKATRGKGVADSLHGGVTKGVTRNMPMTPIDA